MHDLTFVDCILFDNIFVIIYLKVIIYVLNWKYDFETMQIFLKVRM